MKRSRARWLGLCVLTVCMVGCSQQRSRLAQLWPGGGNPSSDSIARSDHGASSLARPSGSVEAKVGNIKNPLSLARLSERRGQEEQATAIYQRIVEETPGNVTAHHRLGVIAAKHGKLDDAAGHFQRALAIKADDAELLNDAGYLCYLRNQSDYAERYLRRAVELEPDNTSAANNLATVLGELGNYEESLRFFKRATNEAEAYSNLAFIFAQRGDYQRALQHYSHALNLDPDLRPAALAMIELGKRVPPSALPTPNGDNTMIARTGSPARETQPDAGRPNDGYAHRGVYPSQGAYPNQGGYPPQDWGNPIAHAKMAVPTQYELGDPRVSRAEYVNRSPAAPEPVLPATVRMLPPVDTTSPVAPADPRPASGFRFDTRAPSAAPLPPTFD